MYKHNIRQLELPDFSFPFEGHLSPNNKWVRYANLIPWDQFEKEYSQNFSSEGSGSTPITCRMALAALIIKEELKLSDRICVEQITENPYLQYFCGLKSFISNTPFDSSMFVYFRKRFPMDILVAVNEAIIDEIRKIESSDDKSDAPPPSSDIGSEEKDEEVPNQGKLLVDATCTPADITYPTDLKLLNKAREKSEKIIDILYESTKSLFGPNPKKPRTYRRRARKQFLLVAKAKRPGQKKIRKACRQQLGYLARNLKSIDNLAQKTPSLEGETGLALLPRKLYKNLLVISEVYRQQQWMYQQRVRRIDNRIVSIDQPHVRPIKRGKAHAETEFGAKINISLVDGYSFVNKISWENFNEGIDLISQLEAYKKRFGCYPESVHADKIYRNRENLRYCKKHGIRLSGPKLGRPKKQTEANAAELKAEKQRERQDASDRNAVEGKFGQVKRRYGLSRIMTKLATTSESAIMMTFIVVNLKRWLSTIYIFLCPKTCLRPTIFGVYVAWKVACRLLQKWPRGLNGGRLHERKYFFSH